jgi:hypothetical protein
MWDEPHQTQFHTKKTVCDGYPPYHTRFINRVRLATHGEPRVVMFPTITCDAGFSDAGDCLIIVLHNHLL